MSVINHAAMQMPFQKRLEMHLKRKYHFTLRHLPP
jgi:hypothetical protein